MVPEPSIVYLAAGVFILVVLCIIVRNLHMPPSFRDKQREREELRRTYLKKQIIPPDEFPDDIGE